MSSRLGASQSKIVSGGVTNSGEGKKRGEDSPDNPREQNKDSLIVVRGQKTEN